MSRPTTVVHPLATLRKAVNLGRQQFALELGLSRPALEKVERGRNPFGAALRERVFVATGVCPGWLAHPRGPIHTADGHALTQQEFTRWTTWRKLSGVSGETPPLPSALGGRRLGPHFRPDCCVGVHRLLEHGPLEVPAAQQPGARRFQEGLERERHRRLCLHLIERARGIARHALGDWAQQEKPLWELLSAMDEHFPGVPALPDPEEAQAVARFLAAEPSGGK